MSPSFDKLRVNKRLMAYTAAAMYGGAAFDGSIEGFLPGDPSFAVAPVLGAVAITVLLVLLGPRLPRAALALLGPIGVALIAYALTATTGAGDGAVLYMWPVLWTTFFFGRRGAISIVSCVGVAHATTLLLLPAASSYPGRWVDVMVSVSVVAVVILTLVHRNDLLLTQLADEARTDALTGLLNRRGFEERASLELAHARREAHAIAVVMFDIDYFKRINDERGHEIGDRVLARIGGLLAAHARDVDVVARLGGEEFVVLLPRCASSNAAVFAERVRGALAADDWAELPAVRVSAGVLATLAPINIEAMLHGADSALYAAKRGGRDRTVVAEADAGDAAQADRQARTRVLN
jgi:diguanylate cyclase (GGDEF)-like protein